MKTLTVRLRALTPLFLGGSDVDSAELRAPAMKGLIRYWARAARGTTRGEEDIFGSTSKRSNVVLQARWSAERRGLRGTQFPAELAYIWYGACVFDRIRNSQDRGQVARRDYWDRGSTFDLIFRFQSAEAETVTKEALWGLIYLGGVGVRSRRGLGAISLEKPPSGWEDLKFEGSAVDFPEFITTWVTGFSARRQKTVPEYTMLWSGARVFVSKTPTLTPDESLRVFAARMKDFRYKDRRSTPKTGDDYRRVATAMGDYGNWTETSSHEVPRRVCFGLPNNYTSRSRRQSRQLPCQINFEGEEHDRRASPLTVTVNETADGFVLTVVDWRCSFLPDGEKIVGYVPPHKVGSERTGDEIRFPGVRKEDSRFIRDLPSENLIAEFLSKQADVLEEVKL